MKEYFKYEFGFVNLDDVNLNLTNSGNWSETKDLSEKNNIIAAKNSNKSSSIVGFIFVFLCIFGYLLYKNFINGTMGLTLILLTVGGGWRAYEYLKTEIGSKFKIPVQKIKEITINNNIVVISFTNGDEELDTHELVGTEEKGIKIMQVLSESILSNASVQH